MEHFNVVMLDSVMWADEPRDTWADRIQKAREAREGALRAKEIREEQRRKDRERANPAPYWWLP